MRALKFVAAIFDSWQICLLGGAGLVILGWQACKILYAADPILAGMTGVVFVFAAIEQFEGALKSLAKKYPRSAA